MNDATDGSKLVRLLLIAACFVIVVKGMQTASPIIVPFLLAVFVAVITTPLFLAMTRRGVPSVVALMVMILILVVLGAAGVAVIGDSLQGLSARLPEYQSKLAEQTNRIWVMLERHGVPRPDRDISDAMDARLVIGYLGAVAATLSGLLGNAFLILLVVAFIYFEAAMLPAKVRALPSVSEATWARLERIVEEVRRYMSLKTVLSLATGVLVAVWLAIMDVDFPIVMGLLAFLLNYVPNIGSFIAAVPGVLLAFIIHGPGPAAVVAGGYVAINVVVGNVLEPRMMGRGLGLSPLVILVSMVFWGWVLGPVGMLLSVPLTMTAKIAMEADQETRGIALLMGAGVPEEQGEGITGTLPSTAGQESKEAAEDS